LRKIHNVC